MVFGWGKKKPEKQEPEITPQKKQIILDDIDDICLLYTSDAADE